MANHLTDKSELRTYQRKALEFAIGHSGTVLALPTGTGKTLVACAWACELLTRSQARQILVLEPSRFLVELTCSHFRRCTDIPTSKVYGVTPIHERVGIWRNQHYRAIVTTAQTALNDDDNASKLGRELVDLELRVLAEARGVTVAALVKEIERNSRGQVDGVEKWLFN